MASLTRRLPKYDRPPVVEVACCIYFHRMPKFQVTHIGKFWDLLKKDYPNVQTQPVLPGPVPPQFDMPAPIVWAQLGVSAFPRSWFVSRDSHNLIQLQDDRIVFNWTKGETDSKYPSYKLVIRKFKAVVSKFARFLTKHDIGPMNILALELNYVNHVDTSNGFTSIDRLHEIFSDLCYDGNRSRIFRNATGINSNVLFELPDNGGQANISIQNGINRANGSQVIKNDIVIKKFIQSSSYEEVWQWFNMAHVAIVTGFTDITTSAAHNIWERTQ